MNKEIEQLKKDRLRLLSMLLVLTGYVERDKDKRVLRAAAGRARNLCLEIGKK